MTRTVAKLVARLLALDEDFGETNAQRLRKSELIKAIRERGNRMRSMKPWLTVTEAAVFAGRHPRNIYRWVRSGRLRSRTASDGTITVQAEHVRRVESVVKRGRPAGTARPVSLRSVVESPHHDA